MPRPLHVTDDKTLREAARAYRRARFPVALTGAGMSVESGIPDFRSPGGLWSVFEPGEYATLDVFLADPSKAWELYRALGKTLEAKVPNPAHTALARLEKGGRLEGIVTQNVDALHQKAGSSNVIEIHGDHQRLQCIACGSLRPFESRCLESREVPICPECRRPLKPNVVLFGEAVRHMAAIEALIDQCDALIVAGTSAQVYPAAGLPLVVHANGGEVFEFNLETTGLTLGGLLSSPVTGYFFPGRAGTTLSAFADAVLKRRCG